MAALIVVDMQSKQKQHDFIDGSLAVNDAAKTIPRIVQLIEKGNWEVIVVSRDCHPQNHISFADTHNKQPFEAITINDHKQELWPVHCVKNSSGFQLHSAIHDALNQSPNEVIYVDKGCDVDKDAYSAFQASSHDVQSILADHRVQNFYVCGLAADFCVKATAMEGHKVTGLPVAVVEDATAAVDDGSDWRGELQECGVYLARTTEVLL
ncbi:hypothetical protein E3P99_01720 [Wallemia hederae]|uniref:nicotinamidase n=1 Tax=Wallemia hederae TaxID=1540922 RepID=A0A4T0FNU3_9BASI|nr:hypothetical protein E3P99_01720 [Wallemia hederae]